MTNHNTSARYASLQAEAKKLRSAARRAEAKGDYDKAGRLRDQVDGIKYELEHMRHNWVGI